MKEIRCENCKKLLMKIAKEKLEISCPRCKEIKVLTKDKKSGNIK